MAARGESLGATLAGLQIVLHLDHHLSLPVLSCCAVSCCGLQVGVAARRESLGATLAGLQEMLMYGLKGMAAYTHHAEALGATSADAYAYINSALHFLAQPAAKDPGRH